MVEPTQSPTPSDAFASNLGAAVGMFYGLFETVFGTGALFVSGVVVSRAVGIDDFGLWSTAILLANVLVILTSLRSEITLSPIIARARGTGEALPLPVLVVPALALVSLLSLSLAVILWIVGLAAGGESDTARLIQLMGVMGLALIPMSLIQVISGALRGLEKMRQAAFTRTLPYLLWLGAAVVLAFMGATLPVFAGAFVVAFGVGAGYALFRYRLLFLPWKQVRAQAARSRRYLRLLVVAGLPLALALVLDRLRNQLSNYLVALWLGSTEAGAYNASFNLSYILSTGLLAIIGIFVPMVARLMAEGNGQQAGLLYQRVTRWLFLPTLAMVVPGVIYAPAVLALYGRGYGMAATAFRLLLVAIALSVCVGPNRVFLIAIGKNRLILLINVIATLVSVGANAILIPAAGLDGAAIAAALTVVLNNGLASGYLWWRLKVQPFTRAYLILIGTGLAVGGVLGWGALVVAGRSLLAGIAFGVIYSGILALWVWKGNFLDDEDLELGRYLMASMKARRRG